MNKLTIFLSHAHKDIEKVRKLREIFESLEFDPLIFYLQCLDDNNNELEDFIKREIDARNVFIYCKSQNAEKSEWVQKELQYIRKSNIKRLYTIDIDLPLNQTLVSLLISLSEFIKRNSIFISCSHSNQDRLLCKTIKDILTQYGYNVIRYEKLENQDKHDTVVKETIKNGIFLPIITNNYMNSVYCMSELEGALYATDYGLKPMILPLIVNCRHVTKLIPKLNDYNPYSFDSIGTSLSEIKLNIFNKLQALN